MQPIAQVVAHALAAKNEAESRELKAAQERDELLQDAMRFRWLQGHTVATGLSRWMGSVQFLGAAIDAAMAAEHEPTPNEPWQAGLL